jgi:hypothetical protein
VAALVVPLLVAAAVLVDSERVQVWLLFPELLTQLLLGLVGQHKHQQAGQQM